jgi:hypothetical protein
MGKTIIIFLFIFSLSANAQENICKYEITVQTVNGNIISTTETKVCNEIVKLDQKSWWESLLESPQYETTLIIVLATLLGH